MRRRRSGAAAPVVPIEGRRQQHAGSAEWLIRACVRACVRRRQRRVEVDRRSRRLLQPRVRARALPILPAVPEGMRGSLGGLGALEGVLRELRRRLEVGGRGAAGHHRLGDLEMFIEMHKPGGEPRCDERVNRRHREERDEGVHHRAQRGASSSSGGSNVSGTLSGPPNLTQNLLLAQPETDDGPHGPGTAHTSLGWTSARSRHTGGERPTNRSFPRHTPTWREEGRCTRDHKVRPSEQRTQPSKPASSRTLTRTTTRPSSSTQHTHIHRHAAHTPVALRTSSHRPTPLSATSAIR